MHQLCYAQSDTHSGGAIIPLPGKVLNDGTDIEFCQVVVQVDHGPVFSCLVLLSSIDNKWEVGITLKPLFFEYDHVSCSVQEFGGASLSEKSLCWFWDYCFSLESCLVPKQ